MSQESSMIESEKRLLELTKILNAKHSEHVLEVFNHSLEMFGHDTARLAEHQNIQIAACRAYIGELHRRIDDMEAKRQ